MASGAYLLDLLPGLRLLGPLGLALLLGTLWRAAFGLPVDARQGVTFAGKVLLAWGVVLLGARLELGLLIQAGIKVIVLDVLVVLVGVALIERLGKWLGLSKGLRLALAVGSSICGPSAIAAAAPIIKARDDELSVSIGLVSLLGVLGAVGFIFVSPLLSAESYGLITGGSLQSVGHVLAAGAAHSSEALELATLTKLTRVALLVPVLLMLSWALSRGEATSETRTLPRLPGFLVGFLLLGAASSGGFIPVPLAEGAGLTSTLLTTAAMAAIGLGVDLKVLRQVGPKALQLALLGFTLIVGLAGLYVYLIT